jgi:hypothetical protein
MTPGSEVRRRATVAGCNGLVTRDLGGKKRDMILSIEAVFAVRNGLPALGVLRDSEGPTVCAQSSVTPDLACSAPEIDHFRVVPSIMGDRR